MPYQFCSLVLSKNTWPYPFIAIKIPEKSFSAKIDGAMDLKIKIYGRKDKGMQTSPKIHGGKMKYGVLRAIQARTPEID